MTQTPVSLAQVHHAVRRAKTTLDAQADGGQVFVKHVLDRDLRAIANGAAEAVAGQADPHDPVQQSVVLYRTPDETPSALRRLANKVVGAQGDVRVADVDLAVRAAMGELERADALPKDGVVSVPEQQRLSPLAVRLLNYAKKDDATAALATRNDGTVVPEGSGSAAGAGVAVAAGAMMMTNVMRS